MFGLGMMEVGVIIVLAVMLFPPTELPKLARSIARIYGQVRKTAEDFRSAVLEDEDLREPINEIKGAYNEARFEVRDAERKARQQLAKAQMELRMATARRIQAEKQAQAEAAGEGQPAVEPAAEPSASSAVAPGAEPPAGVEPPAAADEPAVNPRGAVAGADPRVIAARRSGAYTPRVAAAETPAADAAPADRGDSEQPREGVA